MTSRVLRTAKEVDGRTGDALIKSAFRQLTESDPQKAFGYLSSLPAFLCENAWRPNWQNPGAREMAPRRSMPFTKQDLEFLAKPTDGECLPGSGRRSIRKPAYQRMITLGEPGSERDQRIGSFFNNIAQTDILRDPLGQGASAIFHRPPWRSFHFAFCALSRDDPQAALEAVASLPTSNMRLMALQGVAATGLGEVADRPRSKRRTNCPLRKRRCI